MWIKEASDFKMMIIFFMELNFRIEMLIQKFQTETATQWFTLQRSLEKSKILNNFAKNKEISRIYL